MRFEFKDIDSFLDGDMPYDPPGADQRTLDLDVIMAAAVAVKVYDEMRRKASILMSDAIKDAVEAVEAMNAEGCESACVQILEELSACNEKTLPIDMRTAILLVMTLVGRGRLKPPAGTNPSDVDKAIKESRMVLMSVAGRISKVEKQRPDEN